jgi:hypothetical protein
MQRLLRKVSGRIFFVSHRQTRNYLWSRDVIVPFQITPRDQHFILTPERDEKKKIRNGR